MVFGTRSLKYWVLGPSRPAFQYAEDARLRLVHALLLASGGVSCGSLLDSYAKREHRLRARLPNAENLLSSPWYRDSMVICKGLTKSSEHQSICRLEACKEARHKMMKAPESQPDFSLGSSFGLPHGPPVRTTK